MKNIYAATMAIVIGVLSLAKAGDPLKVGSPAPSIESVDHDGKPWKLADHLGKQPVLVYFYPKDDTPGCTKQACGFRDRLASPSTAGVTIVGVSRDDAASHQAFRAKHSLNFPLLVDTDGKITEAFGAAAPDRPRSRRVSFLIGKDGKIIHITDTRDAQVHLDELNQVLATLKP